MGFLRGNKTEEERIEEERLIILSERQTLVDLAVGTHGTDEIIAGAMMGETGKYIAMAKYGDTKWQTTELLLFDEGIQIYYTGDFFYYNELKSMEKTRGGLFSIEFTLRTTRGPVLFKSYDTRFKALRLVIKELKKKYLELLKQEEINNQQKEIQQESEKKVDRLIEIGKMYENGLLSDEEFASMKQDIFNSNENGNSNDENLNLEVNTTIPQKNTLEDNKTECKNCGNPIEEYSNFCTNCGEKIIK